MRCGVFSNVVCEFSIWEKFGPVVLFVIAESVEILFKFLVDSFRFSICFWVIGRG